MAVNFSEFVFENRNGISVRLSLEAPIGTRVLDTEVAGNSTITVNPRVTDVRGAKISVTAAEHDDYTDTERFELQASPYVLYIEKLSARSAIGSIHGSLSASY